MKKGDLLRLVGICIVAVFITAMGSLLSRGEKGSRATTTRVSLTRDWILTEPADWLGKQVEVRTDGQREALRALLTDQVIEDSYVSALTDEADPELNSYVAESFAAAGPSSYFLPLFLLVGRDRFETLGRDSIVHLLTGTDMEERLAQLDVLIVRFERFMERRAWPTG